MIIPVLLSVTLGGAVDGIWGNVGFGLYPLNGEKVAPNGLVYEPMFRLVADVNVGSEDSYLFANSAYYTEKPQPGVTTNKTQGEFDFTKRQYDFNIGYAAGIAPRTEARFWLYSYSNINRGNSLNQPFGFKDGFIGALRYTLDEASAANGYASVGYYFTKELVDTQGNGYTPSAFAEVEASKFLGGGVRSYARVHVVAERGTGIKEIDTQLGLMYRFGARLRNSAFFYLENDFGEQDLPERRRVLLEFRRVFSGG